jgi:hypothetical protein
MIDPTKPEDGKPSNKQDLRDNLAVIKGEIEDLQRRVAAIFSHRAPYVSVTDWGAKGNGVDDDLEPILAAAQEAERLGLPLLFPGLPEGLYLSNGYLVTDQVGLGNISVLMDAPILYDGPHDRAAIKVGSADNPVWHKRLRLIAAAAWQSNPPDWTNEGYVGTEIVNTSDTEIDVRAEMFTIGIRFKGDKKGFVGNWVTRAYARNCMVGLEFTKDRGGYCNSNTVLSGRVIHDSTLHAPRHATVAGVRSTSVPGAAHANNCNSIYNMDLSISFDAKHGGDELVSQYPVHIVEGNYNNFHNLRSENGYLTPDAMRIEGNATGNSMHLLYDDGRSNGLSQEGTGWNKLTRQYDETEPG